MKNQNQFLKNVLIVINEEVYEIYSVRPDGKIYFWNYEDKSKQFNSTIEELHNKLEKGDWALA